MVAHGQVLGIMHLDSQDRINAFADKDLGLVKAISNQTAIALENCKLLQEIEREVSIRENLGRFLPPHVVDRVIDEGEEPIRKGGRQTHGTILFADIRGFTQISENSSPHEVVELLNDFFERLVHIVFKYDGILDKYIGDCLMATFGTLPNQQSGAELNAIRAALEFKQAVAEMNKQRAEQGKPAISIGVGLNSGNLVAGFIGSSQRLEYTCIGDTVNTASRVCNMASKDQVLITEYTNNLLQGCGALVETRFVGKQLFKGKSQEIDVFEVLAAETPQIITITTEKAANLT
jgi:adenylate cyclase